MYIHRMLNLSEYDDDGGGDNDDDDDEVVSACLPMSQMFDYNFLKISRGRGNLPCVAKDSRCLQLKPLQNASLGEIPRATPRPWRLPLAKQMKGLLD